MQISVGNMIEDLISRFKSSFDMNANCGCHNDDDKYGSPAERRAFTRCWVANHMELFQTITDSELIVETNRMELHQPSLEEIDPVSATSLDVGRKLDLSFIYSGEENIKSVSRNVAETDSGLPGTTVQTNVASVNRSLENPACNSCQSLLKSLCNGCHYKFQTHAQCYFFSVFKKNKSKKLKKLAPDMKLCNNCKVIVTSVHDPPSHVKSIYSDDLPNWSRQRKNLLYKGKKSLCRRPERNFLETKSKVDRKASKQRKNTRKIRTPYTCRRRSSGYQPDETHHGDTAMGSKVRKPSMLVKNNTFKGKAKSITSCDKSYKEIRVSHAAAPQTNQDVVVENVSEQRSSSYSTMSPRMLSPKKRRRCCDAACKIYEDIKSNCRLLTVLPKNWGNLVRREKHATSCS